MDVFKYFNDSLRNAAKEIGFNQPNELQSALIPSIQEGNDLVIYTSAEEGRTLSYLMTLLEKIDAENSYVQALILTPSSEMTHRIQQDFEQINTQEAIQVAGIYGLQEQSKEPWGKGTHIIIGTPPSVLNQITQRALDLYHLQYLVVDKIDEMISNGMTQSLSKVVSNVSDQRQAVIFSASGSSLVDKAISQIASKPKFIAFPVNFFKTSQPHVEYLFVDKEEKQRVLFDFLEAENPISALILVSSNNDVKEWINRFNHFGYRVSFVIREAGKDRLMARAEKGQTRFMIATDIAAKHNKSLLFSHRIIMDLPNDQSRFKELIRWSHEPAMPPRNIVILDPVKFPVLERLAKESNITLQESYRPSEEYLTLKLSERVHSMLEQRYRNVSDKGLENNYRYFPVIEHLLQVENGGRLLGLLVRDFLRRHVHHPLTPDTRSSRSKYTNHGKQRSVYRGVHKSKRAPAPQKRNRKPAKPEEQKPQTKEAEKKPSLFSRLLGKS